MRALPLIAVPLALVALTAGGCRRAAPAATVQGSVTMDGELVRSGRVAFHPVADGPTCYGNIDAQGAFALRIGGGGGLEESEFPAGEYIATVVVTLPSRTDEAIGEGGPPQPGARLSASRYAARETSPLRITVAPGPNVVDLDIDSAATEAPTEPTGETAEGAAEPPGEAADDRGADAPPSPAAAAETAVGDDAAAQGKPATDNSAAPATPAEGSRP